MYVKQYFGFIKPEYLPIVLNDQNEMVAFGITMPSLSSAFQKCKGNLFPFGFIHVLKAMKNILLQKNNQTTRSFFKIY
mgnify:CR=1 FL=1